jgi:hypothetical protein
VQLPFDYVLEALRSFSFSFFSHPRGAAFIFCSFSSQHTRGAAVLYTCPPASRDLILLYTTVYYSMLAICTNSALRP